MKKVYSMIIILVLNIIISFSLAYVYFNKVDNDKILEITQIAYVPVDTETFDKYKEIYKSNNLVAYMEIPGTTLSEPIMQSNDNEYYLTHKADNTVYRTGAAFMDYRNSLNDKQINIYGHNSNVYVAPFHELMKFKDPEFTKMYNKIYLYTPKGLKTYEVFATKRTTSNEHMFLQTDNFSKHLKELRSNTLYDFGTEVTREDNLLVLQTCLLHDNNNVLLVYAKEI